MPASAEKRVVIYCMLLVAATLAFYNPIVHNGFIEFDDSAYIVRNPQVQSGLTWNTVKWSFTTFHVANWHPITWLSHAADCQMFGLNPVGHHYINLLLHAANAALLFLLLWRATGLAWPSLIVGALFALHPINVESVAWVAERKNVLSMTFFLLALIAYDRYARTAKRSLYAWVVILFAIGLMAKPQIVTLPFVLLLWDYWPLQRLGQMDVGVGQTPAQSGAVVSPAIVTRSLGFLVWEKWPLFFLAAADSVITVIAQRSGSAMRTAAEVSIPVRIDNVFVSYVRYLGKMFWPTHLAPMYPHPGNSLPPVEVMGALSLLLLISALLCHWRDRRYLLVGWLWFLGTLVPMIGIVTVGEQAMADRFAYISFIGLFIAVAWNANDWATNPQPQSPQASHSRIGAAPLATAIVVICALGFLTYHQLNYWRDDEALWRYTLSVTEDNYMAHDNLAIAFATQGRSDEAVVEFRAANALHKYPPAQILALAFYEERVGHAHEAIEECNSVLRTSANNDAKIQAVAWSTLGQAHLELREYNEAAESYRNALHFSPESEMALIGSSLVALGQGKSNEAVANLAHAVRIDPSDVNFLLLAQALRQAGRQNDAERATADARKISQDLSHAQIAAGQLLSVADLKNRN
ncbi:MAG TPA: tetratricopeptide repeat protein [Terriglobales bacterium]|jgi:tetratricopeptide (TPR) repeat protein|nr:tetratricopeptide repeat protein [Terriglobales bacterium]